MVDLACRVFVGNLAYRTTCDSLRGHFKKCGKVKRAEVYYDHSGKGPPTVVGRPVSKGCGVVEFEHEEDAQDAIRELAESELDGRNILVREDRDPPAPNRDRSPPPTGKGNGRPGDWVCPKCQDMQFASRVECRSCNEPKPTSKGGGKSKGNFGLNDWTCPNCSDHQFARNVKCRQCGEPKPTPRARSRSRSRSRRRSRSRSPSRKGRHRVRVRVKRERHDKHRSKKQKKKRKVTKPSHKERRKQKEKPKKRRQETSEADSYGYDSEYYSSYYSD